MLRLIIILLFLLLFGIYSLFAFPVMFIMGKFNAEKKQRISQRIVSNAFRVILFFSGCKVTLKGFENIPKDEPVLFVSNHRSYFDIIVCYTILPGLTGFVAKNSFGKVPILRGWMKNLKCVFLDRNNAREGLKTILTAIDQVKSGMNMFICPEGTRNHNPEMLPFKPGSLKIAEKTGCKIIPIALTHTDEAFENHFPTVKAVNIGVNIGEPIEVRSLSADDKKILLENTQNTIQRLLEETA